jgi:hypothetical protein
MQKEIAMKESQVKTVLSWDNKKTNWRKSFIWTSFMNDLNS